MMEALLLVFALGTSPQAWVRQKTSGWCSPSIADTHGNVTDTCTGVDPRALDRLNALLNQENQELNQKIQEANEWAEKYFELEKRLAEPTEDEQLSKEAEAYLHQGDLDKAQSILDGLLQREEHEVDQIAANHFNMALILELQFQPALALPHLETAYRYRPDNIDYSEQYARELVSADKFDQAESVVERNLSHIRELATNDPGGYLPLEAKTLRTLAFIYGSLGKLKEAEGSYEESTGLYAGLAEKDPSTYLLPESEALDGLASIYEKSGMTDEGERCYRESADVFRRAATEFGGVYTVDAAMLLDHLATHYAKLQNTAEAEATYEQLLGTARIMAANNEAGYGWVLALALGHVGDLYAQTGRSAEAEGAYKESLAIFRQMPDSVPVYHKLEAATLNNLGALYASSGKFSDASVSYEEALRTLQAMPGDDPDRPGLAAGEQHNLGIAYYNLGRLTDAEQAYSGSIAVYRTLETTGRPEYMVKLAANLGALGNTYQRDNKLSLAAGAYKECAEICRGLAAADPTAHGLDFAMSLNNLGTFYSQTQQWSDAVDYYTRSLDAFRSLATAGHGHPREEAWVLVNLGGLGLDHHLATKTARAYVEQAVRVQTGLWKTNPSLYGDDLAGGLILKAQFLGLSGRHRAEACGLVSEAQRIASLASVAQAARTLEERCKNSAEKSN